MPRTLIIGPETPRATYSETFTCDDAHCGVHILAFDERDTCIAEVVLSAKQIPQFCDELHGIAYAKAVKRGDE